MTEREELINSVVGLVEDGISDEPTLVHLTEATIEQLNDIREDVLKRLYPDAEE